LADNGLHQHSGSTRVVFVGGKQVSMLEKAGPCYTLEQGQVVRFDAPDGVRVHNAAIGYNRVSVLF
jgi:hypothetical protein